MSISPTKNIQQYNYSKREQKSFNTNDNREYSKNNIEPYIDDEPVFKTKLNTYSSDESLHVSETIGPQIYKAKVKSADLILFTTQLSVMLESGVVLSDALDAIAEQGENGIWPVIRYFAVKRQHHPGQPPQSAW